MATAAQSVSTGTVAANRFGANSGWWVAIGCFIAMAAANVPGIAPLSAGVLACALIYQTNLMLQGK